VRFRGSLNFCFANRSSSSSPFFFLKSGRTSAGLPPPQTASLGRQEQLSLQQQQGTFAPNLSILTRANARPFSAPSTFSSPPVRVRNLSESTATSRAPSSTSSPLVSQLSNNTSSPALSQPSYLASPLISSTTSAVPPRAVYNPLAAFFGTSNPPTASPDLSGSSSFGSPAVGNSFSSEEGNSTEATSTEGEEDERSMPVKTIVGQAVKSSTSTTSFPQPIHLRSPIKLGEDGSSRGSRTPTQAKFPPPLEAVECEPFVRPTPSLQHAEKPVPRRPSVDQSASVPCPSPVRRTRKESLPPPGPTDADGVEQAEARSLRSRSSLGNADPTSPRRLVNKRPSIDVTEKSSIPRPVNHSAHTSLEGRRKASVDASAGSASAQQTATPPRSRANSASGDLSSRASSRTAKALPPPLQPAVPPITRPVTPPASSVRSPTTPRAPLTPKSPRPVPPPLDLASAKATSPSRKRITAEGTTRASALAAAREREKRVAQAALGPDMNAAEQPVQAGAEQAIDVEEEAPSPLHPRFEYAFSAHTVAILHPLLHHVGFNEVVALRQVSKTVRQAIDTAGKELVLERFLGAQGYRSFVSATKSSNGTTIRRYLPPADSITLDLRDLIAFRAGLSLSPDDYARLARSYLSSPDSFSPSSLKLARATTRAWNRVVLRLRSQALLPPKAFNPPAFPDLAPTNAPVHKTGRAASLRVWVPTPASNESWMSDEIVVECEREVYRSSGAWPQLLKGDVVANVAIEAFGNVGKLLFDGRFLRDLSFSFDIVGHLPVRPSPYLRALSSNVSDGSLPFHSLGSTCSLSHLRVSTTSSYRRARIPFFVGPPFFSVPPPLILPPLQTSLSPPSLPASVKQSSSATTESAFLPLKAITWSRSSSIAPVSRL
jgi:hypothetical protein